MKRKIKGLSMENNMDEDKVKKYTADSEDWENGNLGESEEHAVVLDAKYEAELDEAMQLQMISIRLPKKMLEDLKLLAKANGVGYQPLIRDVLDRFVVHEWKAIIRDTLERREKEVRECQELEEKTKREMDALEQKRAA